MSNAYLHDQPLIVIVGPTASGKSRTAITLAQQLQGEIVSVDSLQIYRHLDIGTAKATAHEQQQAVHHLIDIIAPDADYDAAHFQRDADRVIADIATRGRVPILAGGTGLYLKALLHGLFDTPSDPVIRAALREELDQVGPEAMHHTLQEIDPVAATTIKPRDKVRIIRALEVYRITKQPFSALIQAHQHQERRYPALLIGLCPPRPLLYERIGQRVDAMLQAGWSTEIHALRQRGFGPTLKPMNCIGYRELNQMLDGQLEPEDAIRLIRTHTRRYAKRQLTWFRKEPVRWYDTPDDFFDDAEAQHTVRRFLEDPSLPSDWPRPLPPSTPPKRRRKARSTG